jgi:L-aspartate oxidase
VFRETTNPSVATGDGIALAYRAGARVADLEFIQFHPTALDWPGAPRFLISEALRGEGARLVNGAGEPFMVRYHAAGDLAPRDIVARAIVREVERSGGPVCLTLAHLDPDFVRRRFPTIAAMCASFGLDLARDLIPVGPAAHYIMGGVDTDEWGRTSLPGLFAAGEVACTGVHGANRLASNSLLEGLVFGARAALSMKEAPQAAPLKKDRVMADRSWRMASKAISHQPSAVTSEASRAMTSQAVQDLMWRRVGLFRTADGLAGALADLDAAHAAVCESTASPRRPVRRSFSGGGSAVGAKAGLRTAAEWQQLHLITVARLIARAALRRQESRGGHYRADFPERDDRDWRLHVVEQIKDTEVTKDTKVE